MNRIKPTYRIVKTVWHSEYTTYDVQRKIFWWWFSCYTDSQYSPYTELEDAIKDMERRQFKVTQEIVKP